VIVHGVMAQFESLDDLIEAVERVRGEGYTAFDAYSPFPSHELIHAMSLPRSALPWLVLAGGILGALVGYGMQYWIAVVDYPLNVGGRPLHSWPYFVPVTFECTVLFASLAAVFGMLGLNRLPTPYHPVFNDPAFALASAEAFFLCVEARDPKFDRDEVVALFEDLEAQRVAIVPD
jgi:hypothetical protein